MLRQRRACLVLSWFCAAVVWRERHGAAITIYELGTSAQACRWRLSFVLILNLVFSSTRAVAVGVNATASRREGYCLPNALQVYVYSSGLSTLRHRTYRRPTTITVGSINTSAVAHASPTTDLIPSLLLYSYPVTSTLVRWVILPVCNTALGTPDTTDRIAVISSSTPRVV